MDLTRGVDPVLLAALSGPFHPVVLVYVDWPGEAVRVHSGLGQITWGGEVWHGVGERGFVSFPAEAMGAASFAGTMKLGGLPSEIDAHLTLDPRERDVEIFFGAVTERAGTVLRGEPVSAFTGYVDGMGDDEVFDLDGVSSRVITLGIATGPSQRSRGGAYHTYADQVAAHPGDTAGRWLMAARAQSEANTPKW